MPFQLLCKIYSGHVAGQTFLNLDRGNAASAPLPYPGCQQADIDSCVKADLNLYILMTSTSIQLPDGSKLQLSHREDNHVCYKVRLGHFARSVISPLAERQGGGCVHVARVACGRKCPRGGRVLVTGGMWGEMLPLDQAVQQLAG